MNENKITQMLAHEPYSCVMKNYELADILFENEGLMTVPKNSANTIAELLNSAYKNGVKSTIKQYSMIDYPLCTNSGLTYLVSQQGSQGPQGPQGSQGSQGSQESDKQINVFKSKKKFKIF